MKKFSIVIVNFNCATDTIETISALKKFDEGLFDIYLVDNNSNKEDLEILYNKIPSSCIFIKSNKNLGFAGANNLAIIEILKKDYDYIFLLNPDTLVDDPEFFQTIEKEIKSSNADIIGPLVRYYPEKNKIYFAGGYVNRCTGYSEMRYKGFDVSNYKNQNSIECDFITGCAMVVKKEVFKKIGLLPEYYFLYFEETDFCLKSKLNGFKVVFTPKTFIFHKVSTSINYMSPTYVYYMVRNLKIFADKYVYSSCRLVFFLFYYLFWIPGYIFLAVRLKKLFLIKHILKALRS